MWCVMCDVCVRDVSVWMCVDVCVCVWYTCAWCVMCVCDVCVMDVCMWMCVWMCVCGCVC